MRPLQLTISAWGPYPGKVSVDFEAFDEGSVFLVTGPTGAGKTTIFDAICYALYGNVSGSNREKTSVRSDFAAPEVETYVDFTFRHKGKNYQIVRTPKYDRPKKRGEGLTTKAETAVFSQEGEAPIAVVNEVNRKVNEIMGINYVQFKQIAMIAQGEFLSLLFAKSDEKVEIFRNLFQTQIYDKIRQALSERSKNLYGRIKEHSNKMDEAIASIDCGESEELRTAVEMENKNYERIIELLKGDIHSEEAKLKQVRAEAAKIEKEHSEKVARMTEAAECNRNVEQLKVVRSGLERLNLKKDAIEVVKKEIVRGRSAMQVEAHEKLYQEACARSRQWQIRVEEALRQMREIETALTEMNQELAHAEEWKTQSEAKQQRILWLESLLPLFAALAEQEKCRAEAEKALLQAGSKEEAMKLEQAKLRTEKSNRSEQLKQYDKSEAELGRINVEIAEAKQKYMNLQQAMQQLKAINLQEGQLRTVQEQYVAKERELEKVKEAYEAKERLYRSAAVGLAARFLKENEPCPVCGSLEHPHIAVVSHEVPDEAELEREKKVYEQVQAAYTEIYNQAAALSGAVTSKKEELNRVMESLEVAGEQQLMDAFVAMKEQSKQLIAQRDLLLEQIKERDVMKTQLTECEQRLEAMTKELEAIAVSRQKCQTEYDTAAGSIANMKLQLPEGYREAAVVNQELTKVGTERDRLNQQIQQTQAKKENLHARHESTQTLITSHQNQLAASKEEGIRKRTELDEAMISAGFTSQEDYEAAKLSNEMMVQKEQEVQQYQDEVTSLQEQEKHLVACTEGKEMADIELMQQEIAQIGANRTEIQAKIELMNASLMCNRRAWESLKEKYAKIGDLSETYGYVKDLENAARGQNGERIVFEHYVLAAYFEDILMAANQRLAVMTNERYELMKVSKVADQRTKDSLDIEVLDQYTGKRRSVKTLSGGESFKAALSLALGLSDIIQQNAGGIEIDTLFIDEGFGSLDSESLDQALKTLTTLTGKNKLIGIISHVSELKERVDNQIQIEKDHTGSKLKVIC